MNRQVFLNLVENPHLLGTETLEGLALIVADYPFFQSARMLYVKNLALVESIKYNSVLKTSAAFITHRDKLYDLVHATQQIEANTVLTEDTPNEVVTLDHLEIVLDIPEVASETESSQALSNTTLTTSEITASDYFAVSDEIDFSLTTFGKSPIIPIKSSEETKEQIDIIEIPIKNYPAVDLLDFESENNTGYNIETEATIDRLDESNGLTFSDWLIKMRQQRVVAEVTMTQKNEKMDLINNFLKTKPKRIPRMVDFAPLEDAPKKVYDKSDSLLTETLANLYIKQTHFDKAIKIFEKLCLKYPEKNAYFANRINEVEKLINNNL